MRLYHCVKARPDADIDDFFKHENAKEPPSLSENGHLYYGNKCKIVECLPNVPSPGQSASQKEASVMLLDMAAIINIAVPKRAATFGEYVSLDLFPYIIHIMPEKCSRVDAVFDRYLGELSLKSMTRAKRNSSLSRRTRVTPQTAIPKGNLISVYSNHIDLADHNHGRA